MSINDDTKIIDQCEEYFLMRNFHQALKISNSLLSTWDEQQSLQSHNNGTFIHKNTNVNYDYLKMNYSLRTPVNNLFHDNDKRKKNWIVNLSPKTHSVHDRASAVTIQCCYEIYSNKLLQKHTTKEKEYIRKHHTFSKHIQPLLNIYSSVPMPLELAIIWIQFLYAVGDVQSSILCSSKILHHIFITFNNPNDTVVSTRDRLEKIQSPHTQTDGKSANQMVCEKRPWLLHTFNELLYLLIIQILTKIDDLILIQTVIQSVFNMNHEWSGNDNFKGISNAETPNIEALVIIHRNLQDIVMNNPIFSESLLPIIDQLHSMITSALLHEKINAMKSINDPTCSPLKSQNNQDIAVKNNNDNNIINSNPIQSFYCIISKSIFNNTEKIKYFIIVLGMYLVWKRKRKLIKFLYLLKNGTILADFLKKML